MESAAPAVAGLNQPPPQRPSLLHQSSHVNGKGLWSSWERSFKQPIDAMLDLVDNTVDAHLHLGSSCGTAGSADGSTPCRIRIDRGVNAKNYKDDCIQIMNSACPAPIKPMQKILEVFSSNKNQESIGENGVGIKQASACLSNFSIVITKNESHHHHHHHHRGQYSSNAASKHGHQHGGTIEVGFLSKALQRKEGIVLPSYILPLHRNRLEGALLRLIEDDAVFAECIDIFGDKDPDDAPPPTNAAAAAAYDDDIDSSDDEAPDPVGPPQYRQRGLDRLMDTIDTMSSGTGWSKYPSVFCLVLARLRLKPEASQNLLNTLLVKMPKTYIHLRPDQADIRIDGKEIQFQYWERRLVELTVFPIIISRSEIILQTFDKNKSSSNTKKIVGNHWALHPPAPYDTMNVYCGFDATRVQDKTKHSTLHLYIYTRECGRLIKCNDIDARNEIGVGSGSTDFCSGLTVILDDTASTLPLTPTKQDIAWTDAGDQGEIHRQNVYAWLRAVVNMYYTLWKERAFNKSKEQLTSAVVELAPRVAELTSVNNRNAHQHTVIYPLQDAAQFNMFTGFTWTIRCRPNISITSYNDVKVNRRQGSLMWFTTSAQQPATAVKKPCKKPTPKAAPRAAAASRRRHSNDGLMQGDPEECSFSDGTATADAVASSPFAHESGSPSSPRKKCGKRPRADDAEEREEDELLNIELRETEWMNEKRRLESRCRRLQSRNDTLEENKKQLKTELEQSELSQKRLADELKLKELENEKGKSHQQQGGAVAAPPAQQAADFLLAQVEQLQAEKEEQSTLHEAEVAELNRQVGRLKAAKKDQAARLLAKEEKINALETALASMSGSNKELRDELSIMKQNVVSQDEKLDDDDDSNAI